jgi:hypothetical protein
MLLLGAVSLLKSMLGGLVSEWVSGWVLDWALNCVLRCSTANSPLMMHAHSDDAGDTEAPVVKPVVPVRNNYCDVCDHEFTTASGLNRHLTTKTHARAAAAFEVC